MSGAWTDERVETLKALVAEGLSASQISMKIGVRMSRNAIIGKVSRLGLRLGLGEASTPRATTPRVRTEGASVPKPTRPAKPIAAPVAPAAQPDSRPLRLVQAPSRNLRLPQLQDRMCRYIEGDASPADGKGALYCAADCTPDHVYCPAHHSICFIRHITPPKEFERGLRRHFA